MYTKDENRAKCV